MNEAINQLQKLMNVLETHTEVLKNLVAALKHLNQRVERLERFHDTRTSNK